MAGLITDSQPEIPSEQAVFADSLNGKGLDELMRMQREFREKAEEDARLLRKVRTEGVSALSLLLKATEEGPLLADASNQEVYKITKAHGLSDDQFGVAKIPEGMNADQAVAQKQALMNDIFGEGKITCIKVEGRDGKHHIASIGAYAEEINAAKDLFFEQKSFENKAAITKQKIDLIIKTGPKEVQDSGSPQALNTPTTANKQTAELGA